MNDFLSNIDMGALKTQLLTYVPNIFIALAILVAGYVLHFLFRRVVKKAMHKAHIEDALIRIIGKIIKGVFIIVTVIMAVGQLGVNVGAALAGIGVLGIAVGFAAQDSLSNIIAGFIIFIDKPFRVGDFITHDDEYGRVEQITLRSTRIRTQDNTYVVIPNQKIINDVLIDHSTNGETRVVVKVSIAYSASIDDARKALIESALKIDGVLENPEPSVVVDELADSGVNLFVRVWTKDASHERSIYFALTESSKKALDAAGISIPFPHMRVLMDKIDK